MKVRALRWWSRAALDEAAAPIRLAWTRWCRNWEVMPGSVHAAHAFEAAAFDDARPAWMPLESAGSAAWWALTGPGQADLRTLLFGASPERSATTGLPGSLADAVAAAASQDLQRELMVAMRLDRRPTHAPPEPNDETPRAEPTEVPLISRPWSGDLRMRLESPQWHSAHVDLWITAGHAERWLCDGTTRSVPAPAELAPIVRASEAVRRQTIHLRAGLRDIAIDVRTLQSLRIGDVVALPHRLDEALPVTTAPASLSGAPKRVAFAHLGSRDGRRAIELTSSRPEA